MKKILKRFVKKIVFRFIKPPITRITNSNSQAGEDRILNFLFDSIGLRRISYIDIGTNNPRAGNNTYLFYTMGSRGVLVEPDDSYQSQIRKTRPEDIALQVGIGVNNGEMDFFIFNDSSLNTLSKEEAIVRQKTGKFTLMETRKISLVTIDEIIQKYLAGSTPHLISLDVEGMDYEILSSFDFEKYKVPVWVVETCEYSENHIKPKVKTIVDLMLRKGYFVYADTYINTIFVNKEWFDTYRDNG